MNRAGANVSALARLASAIAAAAVVAPGAGSPGAGFVKPGSWRRILRLCRQDGARRRCATSPFVTG
jgi:hypothetical protein